MASTIKYAYLKDQTWLYRRNWPKDIAPLLGSSSMKQSLKTGDLRTARIRAGKVNARYETTVEQCRRGVTVGLEHADWAGDPGVTLDHLRTALAKVDINPVAFRNMTQREVVKVGTIAQRYLNKRSNELRPGGFKSVRYSIGLFASKFGDRSVNSLNRDDGRLFLTLIRQLATVIGKSEKTRGLSLDRLVQFSQGQQTITVRTQKRIWSQVNHFLDWCVYEGQLEANPFKTVLFDQKVSPASYAVLTDDDVSALLNAQDSLLHDPMIMCLLTGMRAGEAAGLVREDIVNKGNLGSFVHVRPNRLRLLKTDAADRLVPLHPVLEGVLRGLPTKGPLFPCLSVNRITKRFSVLRADLGLDRLGVVFHSTRKWFVTQCERTGVPEHFTASLVGHKSARSGNGLTYGIYSAGISDEQKRGIIDQIRLPC